MSFADSQKSQTEITPRQYLAFCRLGTGQDIDMEEYQDFVLENGGVVAHQTRKAIRELTNLKPDELHQLASQATFAGNNAAKRIRSRIRNSIMDHLPFLGKYKKTERATGLREVGIMADDYIKNQIKVYFPGVEKVKLNNEVEMCNDAATLALMAFNDKLAPKVKFEAARKLLLMKFLGEIRDHGERHDHEQALHYIMSFINERVLQLPEHARLGEIFSRYLISRHDPEDLKTIKAEITEEEPVANETDKLTRITHLPTRRTIVTDASGQEREVFFLIETREKTSESRLTKALRYGTPIGEKDLDRNGLRLVFANRNDWEDFFIMFKENLTAEISENLRERLKDEESKEQREVIESRLRMIDQSIIIHEVKDSLNGNDFHGNAKSSSDALKILKFKMLITQASGRQHNYEFQIFLPDGYADTMYRKGVSWEEYNVDRFFREKVDTLLFPEKIYPGIDREHMHLKIMKQAHQKVWNGNSY